MTLRAIYAGCACLALCAGSGQLLAQDQAIPDGDERPALIQNLYACTSVSEATARLACFDREVAAIQQAENDQDLVIADRQQIREARRGLFGFSLPKIRLFGSGDKTDDSVEEVKEIEEALAAFGSTSTGKVVFTLEGGARWIQTDRVPVLGNPKAGDIVRIEQAALGSYKASIDGRRAIRVKRVD